jgi:cyclopropane-fatty-acyl-phospholipid synthase
MLFLVDTSKESGAATEFGALFDQFLGPSSGVNVTFWDGSVYGSSDAKATIALKRPEAMRRIIWAPSELGFARAVVTGDIRIEGDAYHAMSVLSRDPGDIKLGVRSLTDAIRSARRLGLIGKPIAPPVEEARVRGVRHSKQRDREAISHHYDVSNDFYRLVLGETMAYSCARFVEPGMSLDDAQRAKFDLICRKLGLKPGMKLLDVGCGWGGMVLHAAQHYGVEAVGVTIASEQADLARQQVAAAGLSDRVEIRLQDYRDVTGNYEAISSIGMFEHVGRKRMGTYFDHLTGLLTPEGRILNHAISTPNGLVLAKNSFAFRYVFPDGELQDLADTIGAMQVAGLEVRDVETLREHYALTLRQWVKNVERRWDEAVEMVGRNRTRVWWLYMIGSAVSFELNEISLHQVLGVKPGAHGESAMPMTRDEFESGNAR